MSWIPDWPMWVWITLVTGFIPAIVYLIIGWVLAVRWWARLDLSGSGDVGAVGELIPLLALLLIVAWLFTVLLWPVILLLLWVWRLGLWIAERVRV